MRLFATHAGRRPAAVLFALAAISALLAPGIARAQASAAAPQAPAVAADSDLEALRRALQQEEARVRALEQRLAADEANKSAAPAVQPDTLLGTFGPQGFVLRTADGSNQIRLRANLSIDYRDFTDQFTPTTADTFLIRKARPILEGTLENRYDFRFMPDFGLGKTIIQDAWADFRADPRLVFTFGKFKAPVGLERLQLEQYARFIEASLTADLLPYRDLGATVGGSFGRGLLTYAAGIFDGAVDGGSTDANSVPDTNSTGKFTGQGRLYSQPFLHSHWSALRGLGFGIAGTYVDWTGVATSSTTTSLLANYKTPGQQPMFSYRANTGTGAVNKATIADGIERRWVPQFYYAYGIVSLLGEYVDEDQQVRRQLSTTTARKATLHHTAEQLQLAVFLTGEHEAFDSTTPRRNFDPRSGGFGGLEWVARVHELHFDPETFAGGAGSFADPTKAPSAAHAIGTGLNWYLTQNFKIQLNYEVTRFTGGATSGNRPDERVLTSQFALIF
jgi:phosphate-selective porin OprO/OprP